VLTAGEIIAGVYGAWRLARFDPGGMRWFDTSFDGFWRSFGVAILVAPAYALCFYLLDFLESPPPDLARYIVVQGIAYVISWVAFPVVLAYLVPIIEREEEYAGFVIACNWSAIVQMALIVPVSALTLTEALPPGPAQALSLAAKLLLLSYEWFIARTALKLSGFGAVGIVLIDVVVSLTISGTVDVLIAHARSA
jgi:hypothetical protein